MSQGQLSNITILIKHSFKEMYVEKIINQIANVKAKKRHFINFYFIYLRFCFLLNYIVRPVIRFKLVYVDYLYVNGCVT